MKSILFTLALMPLAATSVMAQVSDAPAVVVTDPQSNPLSSSKPSPLPKVQVYTLEAKQAGIICENGKLDWPSHLQFPAGLYRVNPPVKPSSAPATAAPPREDVYTLNFHVVKTGRMTNITALPGIFGISGNDFLSAWAAGWSLGAQTQTLKGCKMTWAVRTDHAPEMALLLTYEALHLRNYLPSIPYTYAGSEACRAADKLMRTRTYPDSRAFQRKPGRPQRVVTRYDVLDNGKVKLGAQIKADAQPDEVAEIVKALAQRSYYPGAAAEDCIQSFAIPPAPLPSDEKSLWPEFRDELYRDSFYKDGGIKDCPNDAMQKVMPFVYNAELYPVAAQRLKVEGLAVVRFDIAPWGEVRVKSSWAHPLPQFARAAEQMVRQSQVQSPATPSERGYSGCQVMVRFINPAELTTDEDS